MFCRDILYSFSCNNAPLSDHNIVQLRSTVLHAACAQCMPMATVSAHGNAATIYMYCYYQPVPGFKMYM